MTTHIPISWLQVEVSEIPPRCASKYGALRNALELLKPRSNQCITVETMEQRQLAFRAASRAGWKLVTRKVPEVGYRVWRVA